MTDIVVDLGYGDAGKGLTTSYLCSIYNIHSLGAAIVIRTNGGHQAGHTIVYDNKRHVFSSFGSGTLQNVATYWSKYCTFYPTAVVNEWNALKKLDKSFTPQLFVNPLCPVVTPYDVQFNQKTETTNKHGSVGVGFGATIQRHENFYKLYVQDLYHPKVLKAKLDNIEAYYNRLLTPDFPMYAGFSSLDRSAFLEYVEDVKKIITIADDNILVDYKHHIYEGAQGILLDQDFGFFPNVTRSNTTSKNAMEMAAVFDDDDFPPTIWYVTRTYQTRHGNGFMTNENPKLKLVNNENETNVNHQFQGQFRIGELDTDMMNYALECDNHFSDCCKKNLVITCMDQYPIDVNELLSKLKTEFSEVYVSRGPSFETMEKIK